MDIVEKNGKPLSKRGKFGGRKYTYRCPHCFEMGVSLSPDDDLKCHCGSMMDMIEVPVMKDGVKVGPDRSPSEIRESVLKQVKQISEL